MRLAIIIVLSIIGIAIVGVVGMYFWAQNEVAQQTGQTTQELRSEARDLRIQSDIGLLRSALELYFLQNVGTAEQGYPASLEDLTPYSDAWLDVAEPDRFHYQQTNNGQGYILEASLHNGEKIRATETESSSAL